MAGNHAAYAALFDRHTVVEVETLEAGVDGLIAVNNRAGGHAGPHTTERLLTEVGDLGLPVVCAGGIGDEREFVQAARFMGVPGWRIIFRHILPNMSSLLIIDATVNVSALILAEVGLSFFGFGVQPPDVSLGTLIGSYWNAALTYPWQFYFPAASLVILVLSINLVNFSAAPSTACSRVAAWCVTAMG